MRGKAWGRCCPDRLRWDHPCVCGEKIFRLSGFTKDEGSPPRMRGKAVSTARKHRPAGITPAYAGKSKTSAVGCPGCRDHPRACGEKFNLKEMSKTLLGSPPRMRGIGVVDVLVSEPLGITPACAGKSGCSWAMYWRRWDHPRVCGEKLSTTSTDIHPAGSPPRVRGKGAFMPSCTPTRGITPACAGKS